LRGFGAGATARATFSGEARAVLLPPLRGCARVPSARFGASKERLAQRQRRFEAGRGLLGQAAQDHRVERGGDGGAPLGGSSRRRVQVSRADLDDVRPAEGWLAREQEVGDGRRASRDRSGRSRRREKRCSRARCRAAYPRVSRSAEKHRPYRFSGPSPDRSPRPWRRRPRARARRR